jgi:putative glycosyltransferase (TIGR04372 family)
MDGGPDFRVVASPIMRTTVAHRVAEFVVDQSWKMIRRPSRLLFIARHLIVRLSRLPMVGHLLIAFATRLRVMPVWRLFPSLSRRLDDVIVRVDFNRGVALLNQNRPQEAYAALSRCLEKSSDPEHFFIGAVCLMVGLGRFTEGMSLFARANQLRQQQARSLGLANSRLRFLPTLWHGAFGHLAQIDYLVKLGILEGRAPEDTILYIAPGAPVANRFLLDQWRPFIKVVERAADLPFPEKQMMALEFSFLAPRLDDGRTVHLWEIAAATYQRWHAEGRPPLVTLPPDTTDEGWSALECAGIPRDAWFVALHVREAASKVHHAELHNILNARVADYIPAITEITRRGGWVIGIGDPNMTPLPRLPGVFDYRHSNLRTDWMDIFLCARARFFLGTSSGPAYVPSIYGVPSVLTNWWPPAQRPWHPADIFIPKRYRQLHDGRMLTLAESLDEPFGYCNSVEHLRHVKGVVVDDNDPDDIRLAVLEMLDRLQGQFPQDDTDLLLRRRVDEIYASRGVHGASSLARDFLRENKHFADPGFVQGTTDGH